MAATTDGASNEKICKSHFPTHQLCLAHGIHLTVCDVLYKVIPDLDEENSALDDAAISDDRNHENEEVCWLQVSIK